jgi:hypothetical protein
MDANSKREWTLIRTNLREWSSKLSYSNEFISHSNNILDNIPKETDRKIKNV